MIKKNKTETTGTSRRNPRRQTRGLPAIYNDALGYFTKEEAKISSKNILSGTMVFIALGVFLEPAAYAAHESLHVSFSTHVNRAGSTSHSNVGGINQHANTTSHASQAATSAHSNFNNHSNTSAVAAHNSATKTINTGAVNTHASKAHANVAALHANTALTKGYFHNNASQGKHTAWTAHNSANTSSHVNTAASSTHTSQAATSRHNNVNSHANTNAVNTVKSINAHGSSAAISRHTSLNTHANTGSSNYHTSIATVNAHSSANTHGSHGSHSSW